MNDQPDEDTQKLRCGKVSNIGVSVPTWSMGSHRLGCVLVPHPGSSPYPGLWVFRKAPSHRRDLLGLWWLVWIPSLASLPCPEAGVPTLLSHGWLPWQLVPILRGLLKTKAPVWNPARPCPLYLFPRLSSGILQHPLWETGTEAQL